MSRAYIEPKYAAGSAGVDGRHVSTRSPGWSPSARSRHAASRDRAAGPRGSSSGTSCRRRAAGRARSGPRTAPRSPRGDRQGSPWSGRSYPAAGDVVGASPEERAGWRDGSGRREERSTARSKIAGIRRSAIELSDGPASDTGSTVDVGMAERPGTCREPPGESRSRRGEGWGSWRRGGGGDGSRVRRFPGGGGRRGGGGGRQTACAVGTGDRRATQRGMSARRRPSAAPIRHVPPV